MPEIDRLLVVDPICNRRAPTMRAWLQAAEEVLPRHFQRVEIWSLENELSEQKLPWLTWRKFPKVSPFWPVQFAAFRTLAWRKFHAVSVEERSRTLTFCSGEHLPIADIRYIHFWNLAQKQVSDSKPDLFPTSLKERIFRNAAFAGERQALKPGSTGEWWCVSRGIAAPIQAAAPFGSVFRYLPNTYSPERFNPGVRREHREAMRNHYRFGADQIVFVFCSFGHFLRKGLLQAVAAVNRLKETGYPVRLLVLGGNERTVADFRKRLGRDGLSTGVVQFAGMVSPAEHHLSAGDAFLFPSHFEAFSLVEIEAAALGMRLYLTDHPGSEMILREGINGRLLPWEVDGMVSVLEEEIRNDKVRGSHHEMGEALTPSDYANQLSLFYEQAIKRKLSEA